jgi:uncharacterized protein YggE
MARKLLILNLSVLIVSQLAALLCIGQAHAQALGPTNGIHVSGRGLVHVEPDLARLTLQVTREGQDANQLKNSLDQVTREVLKLSRTLGIAREDVIAAVVNIQPRYRRGNGSNVLDGVSASRTISIILRDLGGYGELMNGSLKLGVNSISGTQLDTSKRQALERQALDLAMVDARQQAERVAAGFGVVSGILLDVHVGAQSPRPQMAMRAMESSAGGDFSAGQIMIQRDVQATFAIDSAVNPAARAPVSQ